VKNWVTDHINYTTSVFAKIIVFDVRNWMVVHGITNFEQVSENTDNDISNSEQNCSDIGFRGFCD
jgi:hypothetical protein